LSPFDFYPQVIVCTLASQAVDSNALLGASTLSYKYHYWDGVVLPMGLGLSLINNAIWLARHINHDYALTLPDVLSKRYGKVVEIMVSTFTCVSFLCLLAGNLVGMGAVLSYLINISQEGAIWVSPLSTLIRCHDASISVMNTSLSLGAQIFIFVDITARGRKRIFLHNSWRSFRGGIWW
jgi:Na+/pantothenate symporter